MSNGHARTTGRLAHTVEIDGKTYTLSPHVVGVYAELEAYVVSLREDPLALAARACEFANPDQHQAIWTAALRLSSTSRVASTQEITEFENSVPGLAWKFWVCVRDNHPEIKTVEQALNLLEIAGEQKMNEIALKVHLASGEADLGNSTGPTHPQNTEETAGDRAQQDGPSSTPTSPSNTTGHPTK